MNFLITQTELYAHFMARKLTGETESVKNDILGKLDEDKPQNQLEVEGRVLVDVAVDDYGKCDLERSVLLDDYGKCDLERSVLVDDFGKCDLERSVLVDHFGKSDLVGRMQVDMAVAV